VQNMANPDFQARVGQALVDFASDGAYPTDADVQIATANTSVISAAQRALETAKTALEVCYTAFDHVDYG
jgi:hypothetical protein